MKLFEIISALLFVMCIFLVYALEFCCLIRSIWLWTKKRSISKALISKPAIALHIIAFLGILCFLYGHFIEPKWIDVTHIKIPTDKLTHARFRIVQISDTHCEPKVLNEQKAIQIINDLKPDIIVFTGDSLNKTAAKKTFQDLLGGLNASLAKLAVLGNWSSFYPKEINLFAGTGFAELNGKAVSYEKDGETIWFTGLHYYSGHQYGLFADRVPPDQYSIFLYHSPGLIRYAKEKPVDLYLCGHTHGGQIALPFYGALITCSGEGKKFESGLYHLAEMDVYINRGLGMEGGKAPRVRFLARPEITVFDIVPKAEK